MLINEHALQHWIDHFYGYGSWDAKFWFIGHEDTGGEVPEDVADKINYFKTLHAHPNGTLCDIRELYRHVIARWQNSDPPEFNNLHEYRFSEKPKLHGIWKNLIAFVHGYEATQQPALLPYQQHHFLSIPARTEALISLYPLPGPNSHAWYYSWLELPQLPFLKSRGLYEEHVYQKRISTILSNIRLYKPKLVLMYGMENVNRLRQSVSSFFNDAPFRMIKAEKQLVPQYHRTDVTGTTILITTQLPALRHQRIETGFDWEEFGRRTSAVLAG